jgi:hypothetical protein
MQVGRTAEGLRKRWQQDALFREIDEIIEEQWDDKD